MRSTKLLPTMQTLAVLYYMRGRSERVLGLGLTERHLKIVFMRLGICGYKKHTFREISEKFGFSRSRGDQVYRLCIRRIRHICKLKGVCPYNMHILE